MDKREENIEEILNGGCIIPANVEIFRDWLDMNNSEDNGIKMNYVYLPDLDLMWCNLGEEELELLEFEYNSVADEFYIINLLTRVDYTIQLA